MDEQARVARWVDVVGDLLSRPLVTFPHGVIAAELMLTFDTCAVSWNWMHPGGHGFQVFTAMDWQLTPEQQADLASGELLSHHPLFRWYVATGEDAPQTLGRVPRTMVRPGDLELTLEVLGGADGPDQQLSIPYEVGPGTHCAFVVSTRGRDFTDEDLRVAAHIQPLVRGLARQATALRTVPADAPPHQLVHGIGLTSTEVAVLGLLAAGHTAYGIGMRLDRSPRTVNKHLEHIYRKLGVRDRLAAVRAADALGLTPPRRTP